MAKGTLTPHPPAGAQPRVRRGYFECRYGQLHVHNAIPPGGGFEEGTSLLCIHHAGGSGRVFGRFLALAGRDRSVYAPDIPGFGESDPPPSRPAISDYAVALADFLDTMRFRQIDILGYQAGALIATELAIARPQQIRRVVMVSVPVLNDAERDALRRSAWLPSEDGSHLLAQWKRTLDSYGSGVPLEVRARAFADKLRSGIPAWALAATQQYASRERLALLPQTALVLRPKDDFWEATSRARELLPKARFIDLPAQGNAVFEVAPESIVESTKDFLRG